MSGRDDRDTAELLDELATTLDALRAELDDREAGRRPRPPTPGELLRITEQYTIPTVVASLEATVAALELLRAVLRLADPDRSLADRTGRPARAAGRAGESAVAGAERALSELGRVLSGADLPDDPAARDLVADARELSAEVETRLREARDGDGRGSSGRSAAGKRDGPVRIEVESGAPDDGGDGAAGAGATPDDAGVDVDAELDSIRREVRDDPDARTGTDARTEGDDRDRDERTEDDDRDPDERADGNGADEDDVDG